MAKGQHLSNYQRGIVHRYYEHRNTLMVNRLQEAVSDLYLAASDPSSAKAAARKWKSVSDSLVRLGVGPDEVARIVDSRDVTGLAALVGEFTLKG